MSYIPRRLCIRHTDCAFKNEVKKNFQLSKAGLPLPANRQSEAAKVWVNGKFQVCFQTHGGLHESFRLCVSCYFGKDAPKSNTLRAETYRGINSHKRPQASFFVALQISFGRPRKTGQIGQRSVSCLNGQCNAECAFKSGNSSQQIIRRMRCSLSIHWLHYPPVNIYFGLWTMVRPGSPTWQSCFTGRQEYVLYSGYQFRLLVCLKCGLLCSGQESQFGWLFHGKMTKKMQ